MATSKEIRSQIVSIGNTQKITKAMQLVAASKIKKAQERMSESMPYSKKIREVISHVASSHAEYHHPYLHIPEKIERIGLVVVSSDRGLCGGLNVNLFKMLLRDYLPNWEQKNTKVDLCLIGTKAEVFFGQDRFNVVAHTDHLGDVPTIVDLIGTIKVMLDAYYEEKLDGLYIAYNEFINTMIQRPVVEQLLPLEVDEKDTSKGYWDYIYEPGAKKLLDTLLRRYIEAEVYQAAIDNIACEQAARMVAMKSATDNASDLMDDLRLVYNKSRQASITQEIAEIVGGVSALEE